MDTSEVYMEPLYVSAGSRCSHAFIIPGFKYIHVHIYSGWHTTHIQLIYAN